MGNITRGWSTEYGKVKYSVMMEEADLLRLLAECGAEDPVKTLATMTCSDAILAMDAMAQIFQYDALAKVPGEPQEVHRAAGAVHLAVLDKILGKSGLSRPARPRPAEAPTGQPAA